MVAASDDTELVPTTDEPYVLHAPQHAQPARGRGAPDALVNRGITGADSLAGRSRADVRVARVAASIRGSRLDSRLSHLERIGAGP